MPSANPTLRYCISSLTLSYLLFSSSAVGLLRPNGFSVFATTMAPDYTNITSVFASNSTTAVAPVLGGPLWETILYSVLTGIVSVITIIGNFLVIVSFVVERTIRVPSNYFICSLAVSDFLIGLFSMPLYTMYLLMDEWVLGKWVCDLWLSLDYTVCLTSQYTVFFITLDRFCSVKIPAKYRGWRTNRKILIMVAITWVIPTVVFFTSIIGWQYFAGGRTVPSNMCYTQFSEEPLFNTILVIGYYWVTLVVMVFLYACIYQVALRLSREAAERHKKTAQIVTAGEAIGKIGVQLSHTHNHLAGKWKKPKRRKSIVSIDDDSSSSTDRKAPQRPKKFVKRSSKLQLLNNNSTKSLDHKKPDMAVRTITPVPECEQVDHVLPEAEKMQILVNQNSTSNHVGTGNVVFQTEPSVSDYRLDYLLCAPPERLLGLKYIDQDSMISSMCSSENIRLLSDLKVDMSDVVNSDSPVWKRRILPLTAVEEAEGFKSTDSGFATGSSLSKSANSLRPANRDYKRPSSSESGQQSELDNSNADGMLQQHDCNHVQTLSIPSEDQRTSKSSEKDSTPLSDLLAKSPVDDIKKTGARLKAVLNQRRKSVVTSVASRVKNKSEKRAQKALKTISLILGAFVFFWTPYHVITIIYGFCVPCVNLLLYEISYWLCYLNSPLNPFCYALANVAFKKTFIRLLRGDWSLK